VRDRLAAAAPIEHLALGLAAWALHLGRESIDDPLAAELKALYARAMARSTPTERAAEMTCLAPVFGDLAGEPRLIEPLARAIDSLHTQGVEASLERYTR
jgi:fructuronate reductase